MTTPRQESCRIGSETRTKPGSDGESAAAASSPTPAEKKRGLLASDIVDSIRHGCTCKKVNHWMKISSRSLEDYTSKYV